VFCPQCIYVFCVDLRTNSDYFSIQHELIGFYNRGRECLLRGTNWVFISDRYSFALKGSLSTHPQLKTETYCLSSESFISIERVSIECCTTDVGNFNFNLLFLQSTKNFYLKLSSYENLVCDKNYLGHRMFAHKV